MATRISIYDRYGKPLAELNCKARCNWALNAMGKAVLEIARSDPKFNETNLRIGNLILIEHDTLPRWGGRIDTPRKWARDKVVITAYTGEHIIKYFEYPTQLVVGYAGEHFNDILLRFTDYDYLKQYPFTAGTIYYGGVSWSADLTQSRIGGLDRVSEIQRLSGQEWSIEPVLASNGWLQFIASWHLVRGETTDLILEEDRHIAQQNGDLFIEQGEIINVPYLYWNTSGYIADAWGSSDKADVSKVFYGDRFQSSQVTYVDDDTMYAYADRLSAELCEPRKTFNLRVVNHNDCFKQLRIGNTISVRLVNYGFSDTGSLGVEASVRIRGMEFSEEDGFVSLIVEGV